MPHRNLLLPARGAEAAATAADPLHTCQSWLNEDTIQAFLQANQAKPQGLESGCQALTTPVQHPGWNIVGTGHRAITAWRSGRRI